MWPWLKVFPCCLKKKRKLSFKKALKEALINKLDLKSSKSKQMMDENPFLVLGKQNNPIVDKNLGFGMNEYLNVIKYLLFLMLVLVLLSIP